jgi:hypothetical protein
MTTRQQMTWTRGFPGWHEITGWLNRFVGTVASAIPDERRRRQLIADARRSASRLGTSASSLVDATPIVRRRRDQARRRTIAVAAIAGVTGTVLALLFDPDRGRSRRAYLRDRVAGAFRRTGRRLARGMRFMGSTMAGIGSALSRRRRGELIDDVSLAHKVETELFRDPSIDKGRLNVNAQRGVVYLRGTAETPERINAIEDRTRQIAGVRAVENLLHLPGTPARRPSPGGSEGGPRVPERVGANSTR